MNLNAITPYSSGIIDFINFILVPLLLAIAFIMFLWGIYKYFILHAEDEAGKGEGRMFALWGIIGFVIILSVWGLVGVVGDFFNLTGENNPNPPTFKTSR